MQADFFLKTAGQLMKQADLRVLNSISFEVFLYEGLQS